MAKALKPVIEVEEEVFRTAPADNGAGPQWCFGSTCLGRRGDDVFATALETIPHVKPLNNTRWLLLHRSAEGWRTIHRDNGRTREPAPLVVVPDGRVLVSANPTLAPLNAYAGPALPQIAEFNADMPDAGYRLIHPDWGGRPAFSEHSYRTFAADTAGNLLLLQNVGHPSAHWVFRPGDERPQSHGELSWPMGNEYEPKQPLRLCYPSVAVVGKAVHFLGAGDIVEPVTAWRDFKFALTGQKWDYAFRRLFYASTPDITTTPFSPWNELLNLDATAGTCYAMDLAVTPDNRVHLLWYAMSLDRRLREQFFPGQRFTQSIGYAVMHEGQVELRRTLLLGGETDGESAEFRCTGDELPTWARFHVMADGRLALLAVTQGGGGVRNRLFAMRDDGTLEPPTVLDFQRPFNNAVFTATPRAGNVPSDVLDLYGAGAGDAALRYARVRLA